ncbi:MAG: DUF2520 domain-containing protein [Prolixibacteraceae bacterium]
MIQRVTFIGAGNLATQLGKALMKAGIDIVQVYSRTNRSAEALGAILHSPFTNKTEEIDLSSDLVLVALKDDAIGQVLDQVDLRECLIVHTAGSVPAGLLASYSKRYGVFYPLQTFSKIRDVDFSLVPLCLEASSAEILADLKELAAKMSASIYELSSDERKIIHLAAVFACNFVNHFYYLGERLLADNGLDFDLLKPLIKETAARVMAIKPYDAQTGPAKRYDEKIIENHLSLMTGNPELREIYLHMTKSIFQAHKKITE